jgi:hypothetical protein
VYAGSDEPETAKREAGNDMTTTTQTNPTPVRITDSRWQVASRTTDGIGYTVVKTEKGWECNCPNSLAAKPNCWHLNAVREAEARRADNRPCQSRPKPSQELGLYLLTGGAQGAR